MISRRPDVADKFLRTISGWNNVVQAALFNPNTLAPVYSVSAITRPPRFNAFYLIDLASHVDPATSKLELHGMIDNKTPWRLPQLRALPQESQITRLICVEGWRVIGQWNGVRLSRFLKQVGADTRARYISYHCAVGYFGGIDMESALHPQTIIAIDFLGRPLTAPLVHRCAYGSPPSLASRIRNR